MADAYIYIYINILFFFLLLLVRFRFGFILVIVWFLLGFLSLQTRMNTGFEKNMKCLISFVISKNT